MCAFTIRKGIKMPKLFATLVAGLFAATAFAADAPKTAPAAPVEAKSAVEAAAPAKSEAKPATPVEKKTHKKTRKHAAAKAKTEAPAPATK